MEQIFRILFQRRLPPTTKDSLDLSMRLTFAGQYAFAAAHTTSQGVIPISSSTILDAPASNRSCRTVTAILTQAWSDRVSHLYDLHSCESRCVKQSGSSIDVRRLGLCAAVE